MSGMTQMTERGFVLPSPMMLLGGVALAFSLSTLMFYRLYQGAVDDFAHFQAAVEAEQNALKAENDARHAAMVAAAANLARGWDDALRNSRSKPSSVRVQSDCGAREMQALPAPPRKPDGSPAELRLNAERTITTSECETRLNKSFEASAQVLWLQQWAKDQHNASKSK